MPERFFLTTNSSTGALAWDDTLRNRADMPHQSRKPRAGHYASLASVRPIDSRYAGDSEHIFDVSVIDPSRLSLSLML